MDSSIDFWEVESENGKTIFLKEPFPFNAMFEPLYRVQVSKENGNLDFKQIFLHDFDLSVVQNTERLLGLTNESDEDMCLLKDCFLKSIAFDPDNSTFEDDLMIIPDSAIETTIPSSMKTIKQESDVKPGKIFKRKISVAAYNRQVKRQKMRTITLRENYEFLRRVIPGITDDGTLPQHEILLKAVECIQSLKETYVKVVREKEKQKDRMAFLKCILNRRVE